MASPIRRGAHGRTTAGWSESRRTAEEEEEENEEDKGETVARPAPDRKALYRRIHGGRPSGIGVDCYVRHRRRRQRRRRRRRLLSMSLDCPLPFSLARRRRFEARVGSGVLRAAVDGHYCNLFENTVCSFGPLPPPNWIREWMSSGNIIDS